MGQRLWCETLACSLGVDQVSLTDSQNSVVLHSTHAQILHHALDLGIADVGTVDMADQI